MTKAEFAKLLKEDRNEAIKHLLQWTLDTYEYEDLEMMLLLFHQGHTELTPYHEINDIGLISIAVEAGAFEEESNAAEKD